MQGQDGGAEGVDDGFAARGMSGMGAWILGRNMFGPIRGSWPDESWRGWWGETPPYHVPVFVLTHHARPPLEMQGGTTFYSPVLLGRGEALFDGIDWRSLGYRCDEIVPGEKATHIVIAKQG
jgi:dihydrofolate reductase